MVTVVRCIFTLKKLIVVNAKLVDEKANKFLFQIKKSE